MQVVTDAENHQTAEAVKEEMTLKTSLEATQTKAQKEKAQKEMWIGMDAKRAKGGSYNMIGAVYTMTSLEMHAEMNGQRVDEQSHPTVEVVNAQMAENMQSKMIDVVAHHMTEAVNTERKVEAQAAIIEKIIERVSHHGPETL